MGAYVRQGEDGPQLVRGHPEAAEEGWAVAEGRRHMYRVRPDAEHPGSFLAERRPLTGTAWSRLPGTFASSWLAGRACDDAENPPVRKAEESPKGPQQAAQPVMSAVERLRAQRQQRAR
jgi:hypothetical protein